MEGPFRSLDPAHAESKAELLALLNLGEPLLRLDPRTGAPLPGAAEKCTVTGEGRKITCVLRKNLFWSNGEKLTAEDFSYSLRRLLNPATGAWFAPFLKAVRSGEAFQEGALMDSAALGIRAEGENTLVLELDQADPFLLTALVHPATSPVHRKTVERYKDAWWQPAQWVGNGPFLPTGNSASRYLLRKNPHHRNAARIRIEEVQMIPVSTRREGVEKYLKGEVDQFGCRDYGVPSDMLPELAGRKDLAFEPDLSTVFLRLNVTRAPLSQLHLREAMAMALDRKLLSAGVAAPGEKSTLSLIPGGWRDYQPARGYLYNQPGALGILDDLGYCAKGREAAGCKPFPPLDLVHRDHSSWKKKALALQLILQQQLGVTGLRVVAKSDEEFLTLLREGRFDLALDDLSVETERPFDFLQAFRTGQATAAGFTNPAYDRLLDLARTAMNWKEAKGYMRRAEALLLREGGVVPLFHGATPILISPSVKGFTPNLWGYYPFSDISK